MKQLFFDDSKLLCIENLQRKYVAPQLEEVYWDEECSTDWCTVYVFQMKDGTYEMFYVGKDVFSHKMNCVWATSEDGIHFQKKQTQEIHDVLGLPDVETEIGCIYEDPYADEDSRYKMLVCCTNKERVIQENLLYLSSDLRNWRQKQGVCWGEGAEPIVDVFYNQQRECYTICLRPAWGVRSIGYVETKNWEDFTEFSPCMQVDSIDEHLSELYGMKVFEYDGLYIGFPFLYYGLKNEYNAKFLGGNIGCQLAYSEEGRYWKRSLRDFFLEGTTASDILGYETPLTWLSCARKTKEGDVMMYASTSQYVHGEAFGNPGTGRIHVYRVKKDRFIKLETQDKEKESKVCTREMIWHGGELHINLEASNATVSVRETKEFENDWNLLAFSTPLEGFSHEDCESFCGDCTNWVPKFKSGKSFNELIGKTIMVEIRLSDGCLYSIEGNYTSVGNIPACQYRRSLGSKSM